MLPSKRPLYMGNILNVAPKNGNIYSPTLIIMGTVESGRCWAKAAYVWVKATDVQRAQVADVYILLGSGV